MIPAKHVSYVLSQKGEVRTEDNRNYRCREKEFSPDEK